MSSGTSSRSAASLTWQPSLLGGAPTLPDASFPVSRTSLDDDCWVDYAPDWLAGEADLFTTLLDLTPWSKRTRWMFDRLVDEPRLSASWSLDELPAAMPEVIGQIGALLSRRYGRPFDSVGFNLYRDGRDSVAWHRDRIPRAIAEPVVALVSLGMPRPFLLRAYGGGPSRRWRLGGGDLLVTGGLTQRRWEHAVPKVASAGPRISVAYRHG
jgi:alkylated DNA repair dioxygenase AlkB